MESPGQVADWSDAYTRYRPQVLAFLRRRLWGRNELAEDLTQETFARVLKADVIIRNPSKAKSYLFSTANNLLISHLRRKNLVASESDLGSDVPLDSHIDESAADPLMGSQVSQLRERVDGLLAGMPEDQKIAFECGVLGRVPYAEIAEEQGWTISKVKTCVFRARKTLMDGLEEFR